MSNTVTNNDDVSNDPNDIYNSWGYDTDEYEDMDADFMDPIDMQVSDDAGVPGNQVSVQLNSPEDFRKSLQDLENKIDASDLSEKAKQSLLGKVEDAERLVEYTYAESDEEAGKTFKDIAETMSEVSGTMEAAPAAADLDKQLEDLSKQVAKADFPKDDKNQSKWKESIGKMQSTLSLDPSEDNQKKAQDLIKEIQSGLKDSEAAAKKEAEAKAKIPVDLMKKLTSLSSGSLDQTFILNRLHEVYGSAYDYDKDGKISMEDFGKAIEKGAFPPNQIDSKLKNFIYLIDPDLQKDIGDFVDVTESTNAQNPNSCEAGHWFPAYDDLKSATNDFVIALSALYPDAGVGAVPNDNSSIYYGNHKISIFNVTNAFSGNDDGYWYSGNVDDLFA